MATLVSAPENVVPEESSVWDRSGEKHKEIKFC